LSRQIFEKLVPLTASNNAHTRLLAYYFVHKYFEIAKSTIEVSHVSTQLKASIDAMLESQQFLP
jgi:hypothetical protein